MTALAARLLFTLLLAPLAHSTPLPAASLSLRPQLGWNSYDGWSWIVHESDLRANIDYIAKHLLPHGYDLVTLDFYWYISSNGSTLYTDRYGRAQPDPARFPSGVKGVAAYAHSKGLRFGLHTMRGISNQAVLARLPVLGTNYTAKDIVDFSNPCPWGVNGYNNTLFYSVNMSHPAGQRYYDSVYQQYSDWHVDLIKNDCVFGNFAPEQILAVRRAIDRSGRPMILSVSPGTNDRQKIEAIDGIVDQYRVTGDTWDSWADLATHFATAATTADYIAKPSTTRVNGTIVATYSFPDLDMIPMGWLGQAGVEKPPSRWANLSYDEEISWLSLWCIARSPIIYGGDLQHPDSFSLSLLTTDLAVYVNQHSVNNGPIISTASVAVWRAEDEGIRLSGLSFFTVSNLLDTSANVTLSLRALRGTTDNSLLSCELMNIWRAVEAQFGIESALVAVDGTLVTISLRPHASVFVALDCDDSDNRRESRASAATA